MTTGEVVALRPKNDALDRSTDLSTLANIASREHDAAQAAMGSMVQHCIRAGEALILAREKLEAEGRKVPWQQWVAENYSGHFTNAYMCVRFARNAKAILDAGIETKRDALALVRTVEAEARASTMERGPEAKRLVREGLTVSEAARRMDIHRRTVEKLLNPAALKKEREEKNARMKAARAALRRAEKDAETRAAARLLGTSKRKKTLADVYGFVRQAVQAAEAVGSEAIEIQERLYQVEDLVGAKIRGRK